MKVGFLQFQVKFGEPEANRATARRLIGNEQFDLLVLPELCFSGYFMPSRETAAELAEPHSSGVSFAWAEELASNGNGAVVFGFPERANGNLFNSAAAVLPDGTTHLYRKTHLFNLEKEWFDPGDSGFGVFEFRGMRIGMMICFDWTFPEAARTLMLKGADIICHPSNLVMPFCQDAMVTRCLENRVFAITSNRTGADRQGDREFSFTGKSQITGCRGEVLARADGFSDALTFAKIDPTEARDKAVTPHNLIDSDRRPEFYG